MSCMELETMKSNKLSPAPVIVALRLLKDNSSEKKKTWTVARPTRRNRQNTLPVLEQKISLVGDIPPVTGATGPIFPHTLSSCTLTSPNQLWGAEITPALEVSMWILTLPEVQIPKSQSLGFHEYLNNPLIHTAHEVPAVENGENLWPTMEHTVGTVNNLGKPSFAEIREMFARGAINLSKCWSTKGERAADDQVLLASHYCYLSGSLLLLPDIILSAPVEHIHTGSSTVSDSTDTRSCLLSGYPAPADKRLAAPERPNIESTSPKLFSAPRSRFAFEHSSPIPEVRNIMLWSRGSMHITDAVHVWQMLRAARRLERHCGTVPATLVIDLSSNEEYSCNEGSDPVSRPLYQPNISMSSNVDDLQVEFPFGKSCLPESLHTYNYEEDACTEELGKDDSPPSSPPSKAGSIQTSPEELLSYSINTLRDHPTGDLVVEHIKGPPDICQDGKDIAIPNQPQMDLTADSTPELSVPTHDADSAPSPPRARLTDKYDPYDLSNRDLNDSLLPHDNGTGGSPGGHPSEAKKDTSPKGIPLVQGSPEPNSDLGITREVNPDLHIIQQHPRAVCALTAPEQALPTDPSVIGASTITNIMSRPYEQSERMEPHRVGDSGGGNLPQSHRSSRSYSQGQNGDINRGPICVFLKRATGVVTGCFGMRA